MSSGAARVEVAQDGPGDRVVVARLALPDRGRWLVRASIGFVSGGPELAHCAWSSSGSEPFGNVRPESQSVVLAGVTSGASQAEVECLVLSGEADAFLLDDVVLWGVPVR